MKKTAMIIIAIGLLITIFTGFNFITKKKVVELGNLEITKDENHFLSWSPLVGIAIMAVGVGMYLIGQRKKS